MISLEGLWQPQMVTDHASNLVTGLFIAIVDHLLSITKGPTKVSMKETTYYRCDLAQSKYPTHQIKDFTWSSN